MKKLILIAALLAGASTQAYAAPKHAPAGQYYEARAWVSGFLIRASMVCSDGKYDWKAMSITGIKLLAGDMRPISNGYPETVKAWLTHGTELFNNGVMTDGVDAACVVARRNVAEARAIIANERSR
jgi:hypothetical protein